MTATLQCAERLLLCYCNLLQDGRARDLIGILVDRLRPRPAGLQPEMVVAIIRVLAPLQPFVLALSQRFQPKNRLTRQLKSDRKFSQMSLHKDDRSSAFEALQGVFREIKCPEFAVGGNARLPLPDMVIDGVGDKSLPLLPFQAEAIKAVGSQAPYGMGSVTVVDRTVRDSTQVDASQVRFLNPDWQSKVEALTRRVCDELGINGNYVRAELYKVLLYEKGGHFKPHTDTEKADGMFGTLVVQFPSRFTGGRFVARHQGISRSLMGSDDQSARHSHYYVAHYADCEHEIKEITGGLRLAAVYSLSWTRPAGLPLPPSMEPVKQLVQNLPLVGDICLGVLLRHGYSRASLSGLGLRGLKGVDRDFAGTLLAASAALAEQCPPDELVLHIAKAIRTECSSNAQTEGGPAVYFNHVFRADGSQRDPETADLLNTFDIKEHVLNEMRMLKGSEGTEDAEGVVLDEEDSFADDHALREGWWKLIPYATGYTGNQVLRPASTSQVPPN